VEVEKPPGHKHASHSRARDREGGKEGGRVCVCVCACSVERLLVQWHHKDAVSQRQVFGLLGSRSSWHTHLHIYTYKQQSNT